MIEDDYAGLSEASGNHGQAYWLALRRWTEMDPQTAFDFALRRDCQNNGTRLNRSAAVLAWWRNHNPNAAQSTYRKLPTHHRQTLALSMLEVDPNLADELADADPEIRWSLAYRKLISPPPEPTPSISRDRRSLENILSRQAKEPPLPPPFLIQRMSTRDAAHLQTQTPRITDPELRAMALYHLQARTTNTPPIARQPADPWTQVETAIRRGEMPARNVLSHLGEQDARRILRLLPRVAESTAETSLAELTNLVLSGWLRKDPASAIQWAAEAEIWLSPELLENVGGEMSSVFRLIPGGDDRVKSTAFRLLTRHLAEHPGDTRTRALVEELPPMDRDAVLSKLPARP